MGLLKFEKKWIKKKLWTSPCANLESNFRIAIPRIKS